MNRKNILIITITIVSILVSVFLYLNNKSTEPKSEPLFIVESSPKNNAVFVDESIDIKFTLNRFLLPEDSQEIEVEIKPQIEFQSVYTGYSIDINPENSLSLGTDYEIKIIYQNKDLYVLNFFTNPFTKEQIEEEGALQSQADLDFNEEYKRFYENYPWYQQIPIEEKNYRIVYDFNVEQFRIRLLFKPNSESDLSKIIKDAVSDIEKLGVKKPVTNYYVIDFEGNRIDN